MMHGCCPVKTVVHPTTCCVRDFYHPQVVRHIHPVEIVNRHHCVYIPEHVVAVRTRNEWVPTPTPFTG
ncbi:hypothetical protein J31TS4_10040 [Paenibacillus sp. J31TS4]|uniref:CotD family spore coat protein n=1 Tax=Paenibacillus sp. J31TS4 TaxID=2807195 RepID=UPI001B17E9BC|nr:CotD family spore coat protein [Paenibacillus sp. J31TS4]GIP37724.1 hypothetical protein J31TS4_10040 [Paenibacillus sp. J31TS4]